MNSAIEELADLVMKRREGPLVRGALEMFTRHHARGLTMRLLSWLSYKSRPDVPLERLNRRVPSDMQDFIETVPGLARLVMVRDGILQFSPEVSLDEQALAARQAFEMYKPTVSVTYILPRTRQRSIGQVGDESHRHREQ